VAARADALNILNSALLGGEHTALFKVTESYRPGAEGREKTERLLRTLYSLLRDLMFLGSGAPELVHNTDIQSQLSKAGGVRGFRLDCVGL
jgi:DNA polymerase-3 subunit delta'